MRLQRPQLPTAAPNDKFGADLVFKVKTILTGVIDQVNNLTEGQVTAVQNATSAAPTTGSYQQGDYIRNKAPTEQGTAGSKYVVLGFICVAAGTPGTWVPVRALTGN